jgi:hypothetical protein
MKTTEPSEGAATRRRRIGGRGILLAAGFYAWTGAGGCARVLTITQSDHVNTAIHINRPAPDRTGEPLEIDIVSVRAKDLKHEANGRLAPGSGITSEEWFRNRPIPGDKADMQNRGTRFWLPKSQILLMTYDKEYYGQRIGDPLRGAAIDKAKDIRKTFDFPGDLHDEKSVIYVFGKFIDSKGGVLPVPAAEFHPPGAYTRDLFVRIGVDENRAHYGQYVDNVTQRKLHGSGKDTP